MLRAVAPKKPVQLYQLQHPPGKTICLGLLRSRRDKREMFFEDFVVLFSLLQFQVERLTETLGALQVQVAEPLFCVCGEKCVSKVILVLIVGGGAPAVTRGRRTIPKKSRTFDSTMGYPGEDVTISLSLSCLKPNSAMPHPY